MTHAIHNSISRTKGPTMTLALTVDSAGSIVLPSAVRRQLNLSAGSRLRLDVVAQRIELTPEPDADASAPLLAVPGKRTVLRPTGQAFDAAAAVRAERESQAGKNSRKRGGRD
jgi:AbrB family looped-hinge helix DNA binding protein